MNDHLLQQPPFEPVKEKFPSITLSINKKRSLLVQLLLSNGTRSQKLQYFTYQLPEDKPLKLVIREIYCKLDISIVEADLRAQRHHILPRGTDAYGGYRQWRAEEVFHYN
ncbi:hypothetical protein Zmor_019102 [Zophobas morio]|uniref:Uncharacterized protein n=1 Tax=Zophobas morio TaxID=2755281 RepID=A0AA38HKP5_9CUCU|nr:hypothetical protein Zmor_019102 [Zophobas morio]